MENKRIEDGPYAGFLLSLDGLYHFKSSNGFAWLEEFIDGKPTGKFGGPPHDLSKITSMCFCV